MELPRVLRRRRRNPPTNKIADLQLKNPAFRWNFYSDSARIDPRIQTEDIGNDAIDATRLGMKNLERIMANVVEVASYEDGQDYNEVKVAYRALANQYARELGHVIKYIGAAIYRRELAQAKAKPRCTIATRLINSAKL